MSEKFRQTLIGLIWPGPIAGPLPLNLFRILAPLLVFYLQPVRATIVMGFVTSLVCLVYYNLLELTGGKEAIESQLSRLPLALHRNIENKGPLALFASSLVIGVFPYAIFLKLLHYRENQSTLLLLTASFATSLLWTGIFWGSLVEILRAFAFPGNLQYNN